MNLNEAMSKYYKSNWDKAVTEEHDCVTNHKAWEEVDLGTIPKGTKRSSQALGP
jgi:hypothetical protein